MSFPVLPATTTLISILASKLRTSLLAHFWYLIVPSSSKILILSSLPPLAINSLLENFFASEGELNSVFFHRGNLKFMGILKFKIKKIRPNNQRLKKEYEKAKFEALNSLEKAVQNYERNLISQSKLNPKLLYSYVNKKKDVKSRIRALKTENGNVTDEDVEMAV
ncbi:hypothetical protein BpHYR1_001845 [Brachionus plicatilis]|uniref:Uncharacterized protein n=1 Tax=Brachionus plicatilis TaxID=10195 RepID=A0A3M7QV19_BRAPC|nr:hypothetical protein BpHYR1_001845 [Brachionus plicatilis]